MIGLPAELERRAASQWALLARRQLLAHLSAAAIDRLRHAGILILVAPRVYRCAGAPRSWRQRAMIPVLQAGPPVAVSHLAAAYLYQLPCIAQPAVTVTVPHDRSVRTIEGPARRRVLPPGDVREWWGVPATAPARLMLDLSRTTSPVLLQRAFDDLCRLQLLQPSALADRLASGPLPRHNRRHLERVLEQRVTGRVGASPREDWVYDTLAAAGVPLPDRNVLVELGLVAPEVRRRLIELDFVYPEHRVAIEYDGWWAHGLDRTSFHRDRKKVGDLQLEGWVVLVVTSAWSRDELVAKVRRALDQQRRRCF